MNKKMTMRMIDDWRLTVDDYCILLYYIYYIILYCIALYYITLLYYIDDSTCIDDKHQHLYPRLWLLTPKSRCLKAQLNQFWWVHSLPRFQVSMTLRMNWCNPPWEVSPSHQVHVLPGDMWQLQVNVSEARSLGFLPASEPDASKEAEPRVQVWNLR